MTDPILGMSELVNGDTLGYLRQNDRNIVMARLLAPRLTADTQASPTTTYPSSAVVGNMYIVGAGSWSDTGWEGATTNDIAIALSNSPNSPDGWAFITPSDGMRIQDSSGDYIYDSGWTSI